MEYERLELNSRKIDHPEGFQTSSSGTPVQVSTSRASVALAGDPTVRPLVFAAVNDPAFLSARDERKNNFLAAIEPGSAMPLGRRKNQPMSFDDFVGTGFAEHLEAAVGLQNQRGRLTGSALPANLHSRAPVGTGKVTFSAHRKCTEKQHSGAG
jgi:hypothetical protein